MNDFAVSGEAVARVHDGVMGRIRRRRVVRQFAAAAVGVAVLLIALWPAPVEWEALALRMPAAPAAPPWVAPLALSEMARAQARPAERIVLYTDDPDVLIVLVGDGGEE